MNIHESSENYLETILRLKESKGEVRSVDIAAEMQVTKPSVSYAMKRLRENGYILMDKDNLISLTEEGYMIAQKIYRRHRVIAQFLMQIGVNEYDAKVDACKLEHDISTATFEAILKQLKETENIKRNQG